MRLPLFIAYRYLFSKKKVNAINIITAIAMLGFGVGSFAMIVVLSTFNGFENIVEGMINHYDPEIRIVPSKNKTFEYTPDVQAKITSVNRVLGVSQSLEEKVVIKYDNHQEIARIKGVDENFDSERFDSLIIIGEYHLGDSTNAFGIFGGGLSNRLNLFPGSPEMVAVLVPRRDVPYSSFNPMASLSTKYVRASGVFLVKEDVDDEVFITSLDFAQELLSYPNAISALDVYVDEGEEIEDIKATLQNKLGAAYTVKTREELNELIYKIFKSEKWFTFAILALVLFISSFNIFGSLIMLVLDKKKDIAILKAMGAQAQTIRSVFLWQGCYIAIIGGAVGIVIASILVALQEQYSFVTMEGAVIESYPVELLFRDVLLTFATVTLLGYLISIFPARKASKTPISNVN